MLLVLAAAALFVYLRQRADLTETIDHGLARRSDDVAAAHPAVRHAHSPRPAAAGSPTRRTASSRCSRPQGRRVDGTRARARSGAPPRGGAAGVAGPDRARARAPGHRGNGADARPPAGRRGTPARPGRRRLARGPRRDALEPAQVVPDRRSDRRAARLRDRLPARDARAWRPSRRCASGRSGSPWRAAASGCRFRPRRTRSAASARRSTRCSPGWRSRSSGSAGSWPTPATSFAPRSRC